MAHCAKSPSSLSSPSSHCHPNCPNLQLTSSLTSNHHTISLLTNPNSNSTSTIPRILIIIPGSDLSWVGHQITIHLSQIGLKVIASVSRSAPSINPWPPLSIYLLLPIIIINCLPISSSYLQSLHQIPSGSQLV